VYYFPFNKDVKTLFFHPFHH